MIEILLNISRYLMIFIMLFYVYLSFRNKKFLLQNILTGIFFMLSFFTILHHTKSSAWIALALFEVVYAVTTIFLYRLIYPECSKLLLNNMIMLLSIGFVMVFRLVPNSAWKQFVIVAIGTAMSFGVPAVMKHEKFWISMKYTLAGVGIGLLGLTLILGKTSFGANLSIDFGFFSFQPSEFVKLSYVLFLAGILAKATKFSTYIISAALAAVHVIILILSNDLGAGLIFFVVYVIMLFVASGKLRYLFAGLFTGFIGAFAAYRFVGHVRTRVIAWLNPWDVIDGKGYQITQSLFAIGTGGLFGLGLCEGLPTKIPVVAKDFIFAAISEELGLIFAIGVILICFATFMGIMRAAIRVNNDFYKLVAVGFGILYIFQCFLTIGGVTKFIPSTGVTLPFVSYGGSSILSLVIMFAIVQGVFILNNKQAQKRGVAKVEK